MRRLKRVFAAFFLIKFAIAAFAWLDRDPEAPVTWREMRIILLIEAIAIGLIAWEILFHNYALYG